MVNGHGGVRPHWRTLLGALSALDHSVLKERVRRLALAAEEEGAAPTWRCDPVPLPLTSGEFESIERGLSQRARLLEAILADLYGPQSMLEQGALPPSVVHANPGYLRACRDGTGSSSRASGSAPSGAPFLQAYAADLMRGPDGQWRVLADRTGGSLGIGYARESRRLLARVLPELFRSAQVRQLRPFFESWQDALLRRGARTDGRPPVVAMLTPGPSDPHWPEHLALSRDLACALVEARDLTVRGGVLSIKTLDGLQAVDVLVRRVPGGTMDPLELQAGGPSLQGVGIAGLLDAARDGNVVILNHPGTAAIEAPVFAAFMPALCRHLLGEPLLLPTVPTVWLADEGAQRMVSQGFDRWSIRPALDTSAPPAPLHSLSREARAAMERQIAEMPWAFVGCTALTPSRAPGYGTKGLDARPVVLRMFLMHDGFAWRMMQGGLGRVLRPGEHVTETLPVGAIFKDVWVLSEESGLIRGPEPVAQPRVELRRSAGNLPSRVADDFYWLGRYVERLDAQARLARAGLLRRARGAPLPREIAELQVLVRCLRATGLAMAETGLPIEQHVRLSLGPRGSISTGLDNAARLIEALRDRMTVETHGAFTHALRAARAEVQEAVELGQDNGVDVLVHAMAGLQRLATTIAGVATEGMVRGGGRLFLDLGRRIERAMVSGYVLATVLDQPPVRIEGTLRMALELCDSSITYRSRYLSVLQPAPVLDLVLADTGNPRALAYQFNEAGVLLDSAGDADLAALARMFGDDVAVLVAQVAAEPDQAAAVPILCNALIGAGNNAAELSERITRRFFALLPKLQSVGLETA
jgi:uncharacterized circularly permuted ATP-grasp superfamily protein/uncharacterized alpha-E superfamily protein